MRASAGTMRPCRLLMLPSTGLGATSIYMLKCASFYEVLSFFAFIICLGFAFLFLIFIRLRWVLVVLCRLFVVALRASSPVVERGLQRAWGQ